jgi:thioredoxin reductase/ferredoxin
VALDDILDISFEFSSKIGVRDLPRVDANKESDVRGLYVVGDLADAPIIKAALGQGYEVAQHIARRLGPPSTDEDLYDVVVVGAGPAGIGAGLALCETGHRFVILERQRPFDTIQNFPKHKVIFAEPASVPTVAGFWFDDATTEELLERWEQALDEHSLPIVQPENVVDIRKTADRFEVETQSEDGTARVWRTKKVVLAIGRRAAVRRLDIPGEDLDKVIYALRNAEAHAGRRVMVVGGGDSAVEAATACAAAGAEVTLSYRGPVCTRPKARNLQKLDQMVEAGALKALYESVPIEVKPEAVVLEHRGERVEVPNDDLLVLIGTDLPLGFLQKVGIRMQGAMDALRFSWILGFALLTYCFYVLKHKKGFFPFGEGDLFGWVPGALEADLGFRVVDAGFWGTCIYSAIVLGFGLRAYRKYPLPEQKRRYIALMVFQGLFLFGIPELLAPLIIERPWKFYALSVPWPLSIWSLIDAPSWTSDGSTVTAVLWLAAGGLAAFVAIPLYVRSQGERFCSYLCGCGGLAETLGDFWRHLAPRGRTSVQAEWAGRVILLLAIPVTLLILNDAWGFFASGALYSTKTFAQHWYGLMVDFWLASVLGVALYPYLGNRVWCRFFCPLRAYMELLARRFANIAIHSNDKCIGCGECTRYCQMGIPVQQYAQRQLELSNADSACIQCGICVQVCPMDVLSTGPRRDLRLRLD